MESVQHLLKFRVPMIFMTKKFLRSLIIKKYKKVEL